MTLLARLRRALAGPPVLIRRYGSTAAYLASRASGAAMVRTGDALPWPPPALAEAGRSSPTPDSLPCPDNCAPAVDIGRGALSSCWAGDLAPDVND